MYAYTQRVSTTLPTTLTQTHNQTPTRTTTFANHTSLVNPLEHSQLMIRINSRLLNILPNRSIFDLQESSIRRNSLSFEGVLKSCYNSKCQFAFYAEVSYFSIQTRIISLLAIRLRSITQNTCIMYDSRFVSLQNTSIT